MVGGIGFTMSLFIAQLAFPPRTRRSTPRSSAILVGSAVAMVVGLAYGIYTLRGRKPVAFEPVAAEPVVAAEPSVGDEPPSA